MWSPGLFTHIDTDPDNHLSVPLPLKLLLPVLLTNFDCRHSALMRLRSNWLLSEAILSCLFALVLYLLHRSLIVVGPSTDAALFSHVTLLVTS